jgi:ParB-like chromosome segregation protein Spo0J
MNQPYQVLPPLSDEEYAALTADIAERGIRVPIDVDERGQILDGHHRAAIAADLGIECPTRVVADLTEKQKHEHAIAVNLQRRTLTREQRRELIRAELTRDDSRSDREIGRLIGVDHKTVGAVRKELAGEIPQEPERLDPETYFMREFAATYPREMKAAVALVERLKHAGTQVLERHTEGARGDRVHVVL